MTALDVDEETAGQVIEEINEVCASMQGIINNLGSSERAYERNEEENGYIGFVTFQGYDLLSDYNINLTYFSFLIETVLSNVQGNASFEVYVSETLNTSADKTDIQSMAKCLGYTITQDGAKQFVFNSNSAGGQLVLNSINDSINEENAQRLYVYGLSNYSDDFRVNPTLPTVTPDVRVEIK